MRLFVNLAGKPESFDPATRRFDLGTIRPVFMPAPPTLYLVDGTRWVYQANQGDKPKLVEVTADFAALCFVENPHYWEWPNGAAVLTTGAPLPFAFRDAPPDVVLAHLAARNCQPEAPGGVPPQTVGPNRELTECERDILKVIQGAGRRLTTSEILTALSKAGLDHGESTVKTSLSRLVGWSLLDNRRDLKPRGYDRAAERTV